MSENVERILAQLAAGVTQDELLGGVERSEAQDSATWGDNKNSDGAERLVRKSIAQLPGVTSAELTPPRSRWSDTPDITVKLARGEVRKITVYVVADEEALAKKKEVFRGPNIHNDQELERFLLSRGRMFIVAAEKAGPIQESFNAQLDSINKYADKRPTHPHKRRSYR
ncbi:MAG TPA: hypothetical protein VHE53_01230 [Patescibacteria group bacterium]|nr:hypothetical protein [Patescibacteria group bacterium]